MNILLLILVDVYNCVWILRNQDFYSIQCIVAYESSPCWMMAPNIHMLQKVSYKKSVITEISRNIYVVDCKFFSYC